MNDPNRLMKWLLVIGLVVLSLTILYPPSEKLKGGIDIMGGTSLLYEIDTTGLDASLQRDLASKVMGILKERVDPKGQLNLEWRPVGNTRLEIRMPRPPQDALDRRKPYNEALERLTALNISRIEIESALNAPEDQQAAALEALARGSAQRRALIEEVKATDDAYRAAQRAEDTAALASASEAYETAVSNLLNTTMRTGRLTDILALEDKAKREEQLNKLRDEYPLYDQGTMASAQGKLISKVVAAYDAWAEHKADLEDPSDLKRRIRGAGVLEFRILADRDPSNTGYTKDRNPALVQPISKYTEQLAKHGPRPQPGDRFVWLPISDVLRFLRIDSLEEFEARRTAPGVPIVEEYAGRHYALFHDDDNYKMLQTGAKRRKWKLKAAYPDRNPMTGENVVSFQLDPRGGNLFGELTGDNVNRQLCIMLDNTAMSHANIQERITDRCQISGRFTAERVQDLVRVLDAGSLPARLKETPLQEKTIGPSLGETNRRHGVQAAVWGYAAVVLFVLLYYGLVAGGMANIALALNLLFVLALMALMQATFTLPGIAGLILTVGMAIDANVLIFERIREERDRGVIFKKALNTGYDKAFSTIMDANITTLITCVILGFVGSEEVKGFAIVLGLGISTSMFTSLFVTRLAFNSLIAKGWLKDLSMRRLIGRPDIDWMSKRRLFWPVSLVMVIAGLGAFVGVSSTNKEAVFDIEFLGGTSIQIDLKPGVEHTDEEMTRAITGAGAGDTPSAAKWLADAADQLEATDVGLGEEASQFVVRSDELTGDQLATLLQATLEDRIERDGIVTEAHAATIYARSGVFTMESFKAACKEAADAARRASQHLYTARIQSVGDIAETEDAGLSYEVVTVETNRALVQEAILATLGKDLNVQRKITYTTVRDEELTREPFFVVETEDHYLSDVIGGEANFDVRSFRGGAAVLVELDPEEAPLTVEKFEKRLREITLQPEFEQYQTRQTTIFPLGDSQAGADGTPGYRRFAVLAVDDTLLYDDDETRWAEGLARTTLAQVEAALGSEKSLTKVVQFAPQIAGQTRNRAIFAIVLALGAIVSYLWLRFGTKEYGLAAIVALVHDVALTLGFVVLSHFIFNTVVGSALLLDDFKINLPMIAALLTVIGYSLNDTIVVFDRIRENRGKLGTLSPNLVNNSINQTLSRTLLTSLTTFLVVIILYIFGGAGIHAFSFALIIGVVVGTYSSIGIATPLLYRPQLLRNVVVVMVAVGLVGFVFAQVDHATARLVLGGIIVLGCLVMLLRGRSAGAVPAGRPAAV